MSKVEAMGIGDPRWEALNKGFVRGASNFQNWIAPATDFPPEAGRYHLYVNYTCGWCHRVMMVRALKQLDDVVSMSLTSNKMIREPSYKGWAFSDEYPDPHNGATATYDIYNLAQPDYGIKQLTVPILFDTKRKQIVSNDNVQIAFILNSAFAHLDGVPTTPDLYPEASQKGIEEINLIVYPNINNGVYRVGMGAPEHREEGKKDLFDALDKVEAILAKSGSGYLVGSALSLADVRAFPHLFRFDACYYTAFHCDTRTLASYAALSAYVRRIYEHPGIAATCNLRMACLGYHGNDAELALKGWAMKPEYVREPGLSTPGASIQPPRL